MEPAVSVTYSTFKRAPSALLLDSGFTPFQTVSYKKALSLLFRQKAEVVIESDLSIKLLSAILKIPLVLRLVAQIAIRKGSGRDHSMATLSRRNIYLRDKFHCQYCDKDLSKKREQVLATKTGKMKKKKKDQGIISIDHVHPASKGGKMSWNNVVVACYPCNRKKAAKTLEESDMKLLSKPRQPTVFELLDEDLKLKLLAFGIKI